MAEQASEAAIQSEILDYLVRTVPDWRGFFYRTGRRTGRSKWTNPERDNGQPDITGCYKGNWIGLEVKAIKGKPLDSQEEFERRITKPGGHYFIVRSVEDVQAALAEIERGEG